MTLHREKLLWCRKIAYRYLSRHKLQHIIVALVFLSSSCSRLKPESTWNHNKTVGYMPERIHDPQTPYIEQSLILKYAPIYFIEEGNEPYNLIGSPELYTNKNGRVAARVDGKKPMLFCEARTFSTQKDTYTNLIYRVHFPFVPFSIVPFSLTMGKNSGTMIIVTLNSKEEPLLITSVLTCGCFVDIFPTSFCSNDLLPKVKGDSIHSQFTADLSHLPNRLQIPHLSDGLLTVYINSENHRVSDVIWKDERELAKAPMMKPLPAKLLSSLRKLPYRDTTNSFYYIDGAEQGYVRNSSKFFEFLLMSWWVFDSRIGMDKEYGTEGSDSPCFYTSLKPWARKESDMRDFANFLHYWGFDL